MLDRFNLWICQLAAGAQALREREQGQALVEYALILALISVVAIVALTNIGTGVAAKLSKIATDI